MVTYGTFDLFHIGHVRILKRLRALGDRLYVGCATNEFNAIKGKQTVIPYGERVEVLRACRFVEDVFPEKHWDQKPDDIRRLEIDIFGMGADWEGKFDDLSSLCQVVYLPRTEEVSTTSVIQFLQSSPKIR